MCVSRVRKLGVRKPVKILSIVANGPGLPSFQHLGYAGSSAA